MPANELDDTARHVEPTEWRLTLTGAGPDRRWVVGTDESAHDVGFFAEDALPASSDTPDETVTAWLADHLNVTGVVLTSHPDGYWSVGLVG